MLVLVSDGVHKHVDPEAMARLLRDDAPLVCRCLRLVEAARANGSEDDATVLVIHRRAQPRARTWRHGASLVAGARRGRAARRVVLSPPGVCSCPRRPPFSRVQPESSP